MDANTILANAIAAGFDRLSPRDVMLCVLEGANGAGVGSNPPVVYTTNPNTEGLTPADKSKPAVAYSSDGSGSLYGWSVALQQWV